jgi:hypothetical protein
MTPETLKSAANAIITMAEAQTENPHYQLAFQHLSYMRYQIPTFLNAGRKAKAYRWAGFIHGATYMLNTDYSDSARPPFSMPPEFKGVSILGLYQFVGGIDVLVKIILSRGGYIPDKMDTSLRLPAIPLTAKHSTLLYSHRERLKGQMDKLEETDTMFYLGTLQGILWALGLASIDELKNINKPQGA